MGKTKSKKNEETAVGVIRAVECTSGEKADGKMWNRAGIKIEDGDGKTFTVATFDEKDIEKANSLNGKEVKVTYTLSADEKWKNLVEGGIKATVTEETIGGEEEEAPKKEEKKEEETVGEEEPKRPEGAEVEQPASTKTPESMKKVASYQAKADRVQTLIVRQNSYTQANCVVANLLRAVEVGILEKKDVALVSHEKIIELSHKIEADIMRE